MLLARICAGAWCQVVLLAGLSGLVWSDAPGGGGVGWCVCARAPSRISVRDPGWFRGGEMMVDGVIPLG